MSTSLEHSSESLTTEVYEPSVCVVRSLTCGIVCQMIISFFLIAIGGFLFTTCKEATTEFVGVTAFNATFYLLMSIIGVCAIYTRKRKLGLIFGVINVFNAIFITVHELSSYICVQTEKRNNVYCKKFKDALNACTWMSKYSPTSASSMSTTDRTTEISSSMEPTAIVRVVVIVLAIISLLLTIYVVFLTDIAIRAGKPVFLAMRRHRSSIIVGSKINPPLSEKNRTKNLAAIKANSAEERQYKEMKIDVMAKFKKDRKHRRVSVFERVKLSRPDVYSQDQSKSFDSNQKSVSDEQS